MLTLHFYFVGVHRTDKYHHVNPKQEKISNFATKYKTDYE